MPPAEPSHSTAPPLPREGQEWLEADGLGGFAMGTARLARTRRYHALLLSARTPPTRRVALVNGLDATIETPAGTFALSSQRYEPGVTQPDGADRLESFTIVPWPTWTFRLPDGTRVVHELFARRGVPLTALSWRLEGGPSRAALTVRPFFSGRDIHALHHENPAFRFEAETAPGRVTWRPYPDLPSVVAFTNGRYEHAPDWYRNFLYEKERARGLDCIEDLAAPGVLHFDIRRGEAALLLAADGIEGSPLPRVENARAALGRMRAVERRRRAALGAPLGRAADSYLARRGAGSTVVAGYPWFTDWGRDTFIAMRGLCIADGRRTEARSILLEWAGRVSEGMLPAFFPEAGAEPEYNSADASLWFVVAVHDYLSALTGRRPRSAAKDREAIVGAVQAILEGYTRGTRFGIRADEDGLLAVGEPGGLPLTWMDARVDGRAVTPRAGKPVEIEALWVNALAVGAVLDPRWSEPLRRARAAFAARFWSEAEGCLYDVVDPDDARGTVDASIRPNQILAVGGLPFALLEGDRARRVVDVVEARLLTPLGLRTLAPGSPAYRARYEGDVAERDGAYHQGTVWPWLLGPFAEAWVRVRGGTDDARREARERFLEPLLTHLHEFGLGHLSEIADAEPPHNPRGCPFQAWSLGEALRLDREVLANRR